MKTLRNLSALFLFAVVLSTGSAKASGCLNFDNSCCDCSDEDVYCYYWPDSCPNDFCGRVDSACGQAGCGAYGCYVGEYDCNGWCIACPS